MLEVLGLCFLTHLICHLSFTNWLLQAQEQGLGEAEVPKNARRGKGRENACLRSPEAQSEESRWDGGETNNSKYGSACALGQISLCSSCTYFGPGVSLLWATGVVVT